MFWNAFKLVFGACFGFFVFMIFISVLAALIS